MWSSFGLCQNYMQNETESKSKPLSHQESLANRPNVGIRKSILTCIIWTSVLEQPSVD